jgi:hypothetical protein
MNNASAPFPSNSPPPVSRYDKAMRLHRLRSPLSPIASTRWARRGEGGDRQGDAALRGHHSRADGVLTLH